MKREDPHSWPVFDNFPLPRDVGVLSIEIERSGNGIPDAVGKVASIVQAALNGVGGREIGALLAARSMQFALQNRVARLRAERRGFWRGLEDDGVLLPQGRRLEETAESGGGPLLFWGRIEFDIRDLSIAIEVTRKSDAVVVVFDGEAPTVDFGWTGAGESAARQLQFPLWAFSSIGGAVCIARGFGGFDDRDVGVDVFAPNGFLGKLESEVRGIIAGGR